MNESNQGIAFADSASQSLLLEGKLSSQWIGDFFGLHDVDKDDGRTWSRNFFRLRHFVSMYLPMRYRVWHKAGGRRNHETENLLSTLIVAVEEGLWGDLCATASLHEAPENSSLRRLVFGADNPLLLKDNDRANWDALYKEAVKERAATWYHLTAWPRWEAMALHYASFYLPMGLPSDVSVTCYDQLGKSQLRLLEELAPHLHVEVIQLIGLWLAASSALRDSAGIPIVEWRGKETPRLAGRTETEFLLLRS